ncbi:MAG: ferrous iron transport protein B [Pyrinomonadaceae bacterium]
MLVVLAGNPNAGKTTLFNALTGLRQKVANYPGVTVERKQGNWTREDGQPEISLIDLPGLYSLDATSSDEVIARDVIRGEIEGVGKPDVVVVVADASNLERNLYLVTQLAEFDVPVVVALSMLDIAEKRGIVVDAGKLEEMLGIPVVRLNVGKKAELARLRNAVVNARNSGIGKRLGGLTSNDDEIHLSLSDDKAANSIIFKRYAFISDVYQSAVSGVSENDERPSEKIDKILTHRFFGLVILISILLVVFQAIFAWAEIPMDLLDQGVSATGEFVGGILPPGMIHDLIVDGIIAGVGGVLVFLPQILLLFLFVSILEDSGYMARAAFLLDKLMSRFGLHGKAFLPLMSSFACAIPGIMATRTIENKRDRLATILIAPFMSCSARLPVYALMIAAFFSGRTVLGFVSLGAVLMLAMYMLGIATAIIAAFVLKRTILKSPPPPFVMELPPYRFPNPRTVFQNMISRSWLFVRKAGTVILLISVILWGLMYFPRYDSKGAGNVSGSEQIENSFAGKIGKTIEPVLKPLGFDWKIGVAIIASFAAREVLVSTLNIIYNVSGDDEESTTGLVNAIRNTKRANGEPVWTPLTALSLMIFFVLAMQCMSTLAIVRRETNGWRWVIFMFGYMTALAYVASLVTYQGGKLLGFE